MFDKSKSFDDLIMWQKTYHPPQTHVIAKLPGKAGSILLTTVYCLLTTSKRITTWIS
jgi:hypothetical protein